MQKVPTSSGERDSLFAGLALTGLLTLALCLLFGKLLGTFLGGSDTGDDVAKRIFQNFDGAYGGRTIGIKLDAAQAEQGYRAHNIRTKWVVRLARALKRSSAPQPMSVTARNAHTQLTNLQCVYDRISFNASVI